jgi:VWFA-related protein
MLRLQAKILLDILLTGSVLSTCMAQSDIFHPAPLPPSTAAIATINRNVNEVSLVLTVTNGRGHLVRNLNQADFQILDNGQVPDRITFFQAQSNLPLRAGLVIDTSDSVTYRFKFEQESGAMFFHDMLHAPADLGFVVGFNHNVRIAQGLTRDTKALKVSLKGLHLGGNTAVYDAVIAAAHQMTSLPEQQPSRHVIVLITDGDDNSSHAHLEAAVEAALHSESVIYVVSTNPKGRALDPEDKGDDHMKQLCEATGGRLLHSDADGDVASAFSKIEKELRSQYAIAYKPTQDRDGVFHRLMVLGPKELHIFHRLGYFAK